jgi:hypothetical protein
VIEVASAISYTLTTADVGRTTRVREAATTRTARQLRFVRVEMIRPAALVPSRAVGPAGPTV